MSKRSVSVMSSVKRAAGYEEAEQAEQIANEMFQQHKQRRDSEASSTKDDNIEIGALNSGKRIDYQVCFLLQPSVINF